MTKVFFKEHHVQYAVAFAEGDGGAGVCKKI